MTQNFREIPVENLRPGTQQARTRDIESDLDELTRNIGANGQLEPILVIPAQGNGQQQYEIVAGLRRWLAMKRLGAQSIAAIVLDDAEIDEVKARSISLSENLVRRQLHEADLIDACTELYRHYGSIRMVAETLGLPYKKVRTHIKFDRIHPMLKELVRREELDISTAIRVDDHLRSKNVGGADVGPLLRQIAGMTRAQQEHYFRTARTGTRINQAAPDGPGDVSQIVVTLHRTEVVALRGWARRQNITQDTAAANMIRSFLKAVGGRGRTAAAKTT